VPLSLIKRLLSRGSEVEDIVGAKSGSDFTGGNSTETESHTHVNWKS
jgi:hypothetical protein